MFPFPATPLVVQHGALLKSNKHPCRNTYIGDSDWKKSCLFLEKKSSFTCHPVPPVSSDSSVSSYLFFSEENSTYIKLQNLDLKGIYIYPGIPKIIIFNGFPVKIIALLRGLSINKSRGQIFFQSNCYKTYVYHECIRSHISLPSSKFRRRPKCNATAFQQGV